MFKSKITRIIGRPNYVTSYKLKDEILFDKIDKQVYISIVRTKKLVLTTQ
jgi:hypothetical protein